MRFRTVRDDLFMVHVAHFDPQTSFFMVTRSFGYFVIVAVRRRRP